MNKVLVIAETGCIHEGDLQTLFTMAEMAARCGVDVFKTQWTSNAGEMCARRNAPDYRPYYQWLQFPVQWHQTLADYCAVYGLGYATTVYLPQDVEVIDPYVAMYKVSSFEAEDQELLEAYAQIMSRKINKQIVVSLGMNAAPPYWLATRFPERVKFLHCVSAYPAPLGSLELGKIKDRQFHGFSDHSAAQHTHVGALAVAAGAEIVERHIRLESAREQNPDYAVASTEHQLRSYVQQLRMASASTVASAVDVEEPMRKYKVRPKGTK